MRTLIGALALLVLVSACSGGDTGAPASATSLTPTPISAPVSAPAAETRPSATDLATSTTPASTTSTSPPTTASTTTSTTLPARDLVADATATIERFFELERACFGDFADCDAASFAAVALPEIVDARAENVLEANAAGVVVVGGESITGRVEGAWRSSHDPDVVVAQVCTTRAFGSSIPPEPAVVESVVVRSIVFVQLDADGAMRMRADDVEVGLDAQREPLTSCEGAPDLLRPAPGGPVAVYALPSRAPAGASPADAAKADFTRAMAWTLTCLGALPQCDESSITDHYTGGELTDLREVIASRERNGIGAHALDTYVYAITGVTASPNDPSTIEIDDCAEDGVHLVALVDGGEVLIDDEVYSANWQAQMRLGDDGIWRIAQDVRVGESREGRERSLCR